MNPLAIGVTLGGLLLDLVVPRPKPRAGMAYEPVHSTSAVPRTPWRVSALGEDEGASIASGSLRSTRVASR
jgi:hypothetical protein